MFSLSITDRDIEKLELYNADVLRGVEPTKALKENLIGASSGAVKLAEAAIQAADGEKKATVETNALKGATDGATASFIGARIAAVALQTAISFGIALAVQGLITLFQKLSSVMPTIENTGTWLKESSEKVKTTKNEITNLNEKLTTTQNRIDELKAKTKDGLSIVEQNELDKLTQLNSELKAQIELQKYSLSEAQTKTINNFVESVKAIGNHSFGSDIPWWVSLIGGNSIKNLSSVYTDSIKFADNVKSFNETGNADVTWMQSYYESLQQVKGYLGDFDYSLLPKDAQATLDYIQDVQNALLIVRDKGKNAQDVFDNIYDSQRFSGAKQSIEELKNSGQLTAETLQNLYNNDTTTNGVKAMISNMQQVGLVTDDSKKSFEQLTNQVLQANNAVETVATTEKISFSDLINDDEVKTKIADFETQLSTLSQALEDVRNGNLSNSKFVTLIKKFPELAAHTNDLESAIRNLIETEKTEVNTQFDKWKDKVTDEDISKVNTLNESLKATGDIIEKISTKSLKTVIDDVENVNSKISDIISDYNTNKYLTLENLEDLSNIAPEYLNFLVNENGQISSNTKAYKAYLTSKVKSLLVDNLETLYSTILGMTAEEAQAYKNKKAYDEETDSVKALLTATTQLYYTKAEAKDKENNTTAYTDAMKTAFSTASAYASIFESYINSLSSSQNELSSSTDSATSSLNAEKTALENTKTALENQKTALENTKTGYENAKSSIETLIDWVEKYIKQVKNDEIDALEKKKSAIDDLIEAQKDLLNAEKDEYDWQNTIADKQNTVAKDALAASIASLDDSSAGKKAQKQTAETLADSRKDIIDELYDHSINERLDYLDTLKDKQDDYYDKQITAINNYLNDEVQLYKDACSMIDNDNGTLYNKLLTYCKKYTTTTESEFVNMWTSAQTALSSYNTANLGTFD